MNIMQTESIKNFLQRMTHPDLAALYNFQMECQVNVAQDNGQRIEGEYKGKLWHGWTDLNTGEKWKPIRIPYNAKSNPTYEDKPMQFDLARHAEGIGMTGWNWLKKQSLYFGYDFDAIVGHSINHEKKLTDKELKEVEEAVANVPWTTLRRSTSGRGLHLYIFVENAPAENHDEHAAMARSVLGLLSGITGYDLQTKVDAAGGNLWVWHRKMLNTNGLELLKQGTVLDTIPHNWKEHLPVIRGRRKKTLPTFIGDDEAIEFEELSGQRTRIELDPQHIKLLEYIREHSYSSWWDQDHNMLVTHTWYLLKAHKDLGLRGIFETLGTGKDSPNDINCFAFPLRKGGWVVRRYTKGVAEANSWSQDVNGWTKCYYNQLPDFDTASKSYGGLQNDKGIYVFNEASVAEKTLKMLGIETNLDKSIEHRKATLRYKDNKVVLDVARSDLDQNMEGFLREGKGSKETWQKVFNYQKPVNQEADIQNFDDVIRHVVSESGESAGWRIKSDTDWNSEPLEHVKLVLYKHGLTATQAVQILGGNVMRYWKLVNRPFEPEYPGDRTWNRKSAQFNYHPNLSDNRTFPTWSKILNHCGKGLDKNIRTHPWAQRYSVLTGGDYLKIWLASCFQQPRHPLPYLFFYGDQDVGKSIFYESLELIINPYGIVEANNALQSKGHFNGEIATAVICYVNEVDLSQGNNGNIEAYNKIKNWVTAIMLGIHEKGKTFYMVPNTSHWIQTANNPNFCPIFPGDTRITMINIPPLTVEEKVPKGQLLNMLKKEASDFIGELLSIEIPPSSDRLNVPVIETEEKLKAQKSNMTMLEHFIDQNIHPFQGRTIPFKEFTERFHAWLGPNESYDWTKSKISKNIPDKYVQGNSRRDSNQVHLTNCSWEPMPANHLPLPRLVIKDGKIYSEDEL